MPHAMGFRRLSIEFARSARCPLCNAAGSERFAVDRQHYYFGRLQIPLPRGGVQLLECPRCSLLFKSAMPTAKGLQTVMSAGATEVWREKKGPHPALAMMRPHIEDARRFLDIGASNGDLLRQLKAGGAEVSALDITEYPKCREIVDGEYIIGQLDGELEWSGHGYDVVTAFDIFEHFLSAERALQNVIGLVRPGGKVIVETGDWRTVADPGRWYYCHLFEHQLFWTRETFEYACAHHGCRLEQYSLVIHKGRRALGRLKRLGLSVVVRFAADPWFERAFLMLGRDARQFGAPDIIDHAFAVLARDRSELGAS